MPKTEKEIPQFSAGMAGGCDNAQSGLIALGFAKKRHKNQR